MRKRCQYSPPKEGCKVLKFYKASPICRVGNPPLDGREAVLARTKKETNFLFQHKWGNGHYVLHPDKYLRLPTVPSMVP